MTVQINQQSKDFSVTSQISMEDVAEVAQLGFKTIINNRPDGEGGASQPSSVQLKAAAEKLGLAYFYIPVVPNNIQPAQIAEFGVAYANAAKPVLGFCRTGNRATSIYALANAGGGAQAQGLFAWLKSKCLITRLWRWYKAKGSLMAHCSCDKKNPS